MAGRRPKPTSLRVLQGNPGKRSLPKSEPKPVVGSAPAPEWLEPEARAFWDHYAEILVRTRVLTEADRAALELLCTTWAKWKRAERVLIEQGSSLVVDTDAGPVVTTRPEVRIEADAAKRLRLLLGEFGLTPSSRARVSTAGEDQQRDPMDELLAERGA